MANLYETVNVNGLGVAGTPAGGVVSVQGVAGGTPVPVSISSGGGGTQYVDGATVATPTGTLGLSYDGTIVHALTGDANNFLFVNIGGSEAYDDGAGAFNVDLAKINGSTVAIGTAQIGINVVSWGSGATALGAMANYGTSPGAVKVPGVNSFVTNIVEVSPTTAANTVSNPFFTEITDGTNAMGAMTNFGTTPGAVKALDVNASIFVGTVAASNKSTTISTGTLDVNIVGSLGVTNSVTNGTFMAITDNTTKVGVISGTTALKTDLSSVAGTAVTSVPVAFGTGTPANNAQNVNAAQYVGTTPVRSNQTTTATGAIDHNLVGIKGTTVVTAASGVQQVGIVGNAAATLDSTIGAATAPTNALATSVVYQSTIPALTAGQAVAQQSDTTGATYVNTEGRKKTFSCYQTFTAAAGVIAVLPGNATNVVRVLRVEVSISTTGTAAIETVSLIKTSAAPTSGTSAAMTAVPHDSGFSAAVSAPLNYTVAPTPGAAVGTIRGIQFADSSASALPGANTWLWDWGMRPGTAVVLRGTAQTLEINLAAVVSTQTATVSFEWTEE